MSYFETLEKACQSADEEEFRLAICRVLFRALSELMQQETTAKITGIIHSYMNDPRLSDAHLASAYNWFIARCHCGLGTLAVREGLDGTEALNTAVAALDTNSNSLQGPLASLADIETAQQNTTSWAQLTVLDGARILLIGDKPKTVSVIDGKGLLVEKDPLGNYKNGSIVNIKISRIDGTGNGFIYPALDGPALQDKFIASLATAQKYIAEISPQFNKMNLCLEFPKHGDITAIAGSSLSAAIAILGQALVNDIFSIDPGMVISASIEHQGRDWVLGNVGGIGPKIEELLRQGSIKKLYFARDDLYKTADHTGLTLIPLSTPNDLYQQIVHLPQVIDKFLRLQNEDILTIIKHKGIVPENITSSEFFEKWYLPVLIPCREERDIPDETGKNTRQTVNVEYTINELVELHPALLLQAPTGAGKTCIVADAIYHQTQTTHEALKKDACTESIMLPIYINCKKLSKIASEVKGKAFTSVELLHTYLKSVYENLDKHDDWFKKTLQGLNCPLLIIFDALDEAADPEALYAQIISFKDHLENSDKHKLILTVRSDRRQSFPISFGEIATLPVWGEIQRTKLITNWDPEADIQQFNARISQDPLLSKLVELPLFASYLCQQFIKNEFQQLHATPFLESFILYYLKTWLGFRTHNYDAWRQKLQKIAFDAVNRSQPENSITGEVIRQVVPAEMLSNHTETYPLLYPDSADGWRFTHPYIRDYLAALQVAQQLIKADNNSENTRCAQWLLHPERKQVALFMVDVLRDMGQDQLLKNFILCLARQRDKFAPQLQRGFYLACSCCRALPEQMLNSPEIQKLIYRLLPRLLSPKAWPHEQAIQSIRDMGETAGEVIITKLISWVNIDEMQKLSWYERVVDMNLASQWAKDDWTISNSPAWYGTLIMGDASFRKHIAAWLLGEIGPVGTRGFETLLLQLMITDEVTYSNSIFNVVFKSIGTAELTSAFNNVIDCGVIDKNKKLNSNFTGLSQYIPISTNHLKKLLVSKNAEDVNMALYNLQKHKTDSIEFVDGLFDLIKNTINDDMCKSAAWALDQVIGNLDDDEYQKAINRIISIYAGNEMGWGAEQRACSILALYGQGKKTLKAIPSLIEYISVNTHARHILWALGALKAILKEAVKIDFISVCQIQKLLEELSKKHYKEFTNDQAYVYLREAIFETLGYLSHFTSVNETLVILEFLQRGLQAESQMPNDHSGCAKGLSHVISVLMKANPEIENPSQTPLYQTAQVAAQMLFDITCEQAKESSLSSSFEAMLAFIVKIVEIDIKPALLNRDDVINLLVAVVTKDEFMTSTRAAEYLVKLKTVEAIPQLIKSLNAYYSYRSIKVIRKLCIDNPELAAPVLIEALRQRRQQRRDRSVQQRVKMFDEDESFILEVIRCVGLTGPSAKEVASDLRDLVSHSEFRVRRSGILALGAIQDNSAQTREMFNKLLRKPELRDFAAVALAQSVTDKAKNYKAIIKRLLEIGNKPFALDKLRSESSDQRHATDIKRLMDAGYAIEDTNIQHDSLVNIMLLDEALPATIKNQVNTAIEAILTRRYKSGDQVNIFNDIIQNAKYIETKDVSKGFSNIANIALIFGFLGCFPQFMSVITPLGGPVVLFMTGVIAATVSYILNAFLRDEMFVIQKGIRILAHLIMAMGAIGYLGILQDIDWHVANVFTRINDQVETFAMIHGGTRNVFLIGLGLLVINQIMSNFIYKKD